MKRLFNRKRIFGALALGSLAGAAISAFLSTRKRDRNPEKLAVDIKDMAKNIEKKARRQAKDLHKEEWVAKEKEKIMNHLKH